MIFDYQPTLSLGQAREIAATHFGVEGASATLPSDRDQNFIIETEDGRRFVLKISNAMASEKRVRFENQAIQAIGDAIQPVSTPRPVRGIAGSDTVEIRANDRSYQTRLLAWVDGKPLATFRPHTPELFHEIGAVLGRLGIASRFLEEAGEPTSPEWDLRRAGHIVSTHLECVADRRRVEVIEAHLRRFVRRTEPLLIT